MQSFIVGEGGGPLHHALAAVVKELRLSLCYAKGLAQLRLDRAFAEAERPLVLVPDAQALPATVTEVVDFAREFNGQAFVVYVADTIAPADYKRLVRTDSADWITLRDCRDELPELVARLAVADTSGRAAKIVSFVPSKGGVGNTTLVVETAVLMAARRKRGGLRIAILDLNLQGGTVADALDLEPRFDLSEIVDRPERLDEQLIDIFTSRYSKNLDVFASSKSRLGLDGVKSELLFTFIDSIAGRYDAILFDLPVHWSSWTDTLLKGSDAVVISGTESVPGLRRLTTALDHIDRLALPGSKLAVVVNAVETDLLGRASRRMLIERALAKRQSFLVRHDGKSASRALDIGKPLSELAPQSRMVKDVKCLAVWIEKATGQSQESRVKTPLLREALA
ncbi:AAA family ATPase [Lichenifustis flavocetrariae]|uniref:AAA family ATPase n=1 Tax=Lichenifustis flavocetrariae TaxID=2949735 RepID=A0AA42CLT4_9HYPH|nr:AAA family ATPase [Lichenifustis flavocetrariae]MCW6511944.1 AAA family ATPase [Lichenifustis flavocetrariae]